MLLQIHLPNHDEAIAFNRRRWDEVLLDPQWNRYPGKIETNGFGQIVLTPPADFSHGRRQFQIAKMIEQEIGGRAMTECPISTADGVKAADAAWFSEQRYKQVRNQRVVEISPEICVEVFSPCNIVLAMEVKRQLYFDAGAIECWTCDSVGKMDFYHIEQPDFALTQSTLCPDFPSTITD